MRIALFLKTLVKFLLQRGTRRSYAQFGEDLIVRPFLPTRKGIYVDVGCYHPHLYSNTFRLYTQGWSGIAIDINPEVEWLFRFFRPRDTFMRAAVGSGASGTYNMFKDGAYNTLDATLVPEYDKKSKFVKSIPVGTVPLATLCTHVEQIDLMSIDCEGMDLEVLQTHDWLKPPRVIIVEAAPDSSTAAFLIGKGYRLVGLTMLNSIYSYNV